MITPNLVTEPKEQKINLSPPEGREGNFKLKPLW